MRTLVMIRHGQSLWNRENRFTGWADIDLSEQGREQAEEHRIVVTPTLLKTFPAPRVWIAGEFDRPQVLQRLLEQAGVQARK